MVTQSLLFENAVLPPLELDICAVTDHHPTFVGITKRINVGAELLLPPPIWPKSAEHTHCPSARRVEVVNRGHRCDQTSSLELALGKHGAPL